jgi:hypothetical protein
MIDSQIIEDIIKKYYDFSEVENTKYSVTFHINNREHEKTFGDLLDDLEKIGTTAFTNDFPDNQIIVISSFNMGRDRNGLRTLMLFISVATLLYSGYIYYSSYYSSFSIFRSILYGALFYGLPVISILLFREAGKYLALRKDHIKYKFPIFVPSLGIGTLGTINSNKNQFRTSRSMIRAGGLSILFGFFASIIIIIVGSITMPFAQYNASVYSPISFLNFPLLFPLVLDHFFPVFMIPDPLELAGYTGLVTTALNAMPLGFTDGGLVFSGVLGKRFKYASYGATLILIFASFIYPYILILVVLSLLLGIKGPLPMNNFFKPRPSLKSWALIIVIIMIIGFAPLPFHNINNSSVAIADSCYVVDHNDPGNVTINVTVQNHGTNIVPSFYINPGKFIVNGIVGTNTTGTTYMLNLITYRSNYTGRQNFNITVNAGTETFHRTVSVYFLNEVKNIQFANVSNPLHIKEYEGVPFNLTINNSGSLPVMARIISISNNMNVYMLGSSNSATMINLSGDPYHGLRMNMKPGQNQTLWLEARTPGTWKIVILESGGQAAVANIHIKPDPRSPQNPISNNPAVIYYKTPFSRPIHPVNYLG